MGVFKPDAGHLCCLDECGLGSEFELICVITPAAHLLRPNLLSDRAERS